MLSLTSASPREALVKGAVLGALVSVAIVLIAWSGLLSPRIGLRVEARDLSQTDFAFVPDPLVLAPASAVALTFINASSEPHNLVLLAPIDRRTGYAVEPGDSRVIEFNAPAVGTYRFVCTIHEGMNGTLLVE
ncbi:MAG TPA: cupredoxin domain-containing protein [Candidatus Limnocylindrales bacterium]|nr:cupredoxin domain-containing protein [Candidatus Limnocylindrales bacterium]